MRAVSAAVGPVVAGVAVVLLPTQPLGILVQPETYQQSPRWDAAHRLLERIPVDSTVETGVVLMPYLVPRAEVLWIGNQNPAPEYLVVDAEDWSWGATRPEDAAQYAEQRYPDTEYTLVFQEAGYQLVERTR